MIPLPSPSFCLLIPASHLSFPPVSFQATTTLQEERRRRTPASMLRATTLEDYGRRRRLGELPTWQINGWMAERNSGGVSSTYGSSFPLSRSTETATAIYPPSAVVCSDDDGCKQLQQWRPSRGVAAVTGEATQWHSTLRKLVAEHLGGVDLSTVVPRSMKQMVAERPAESLASTGDLLTDVFSFISVAAFHISGGVGQRMKVTLVTVVRSAASLDFPRSIGDVRLGGE
nr:hypothetical protein Iba_chr03cCG5720 [Ipomoea batatas]